MWHFVVLQTLSSRDLDLSGVISRGGLGLETVSRPENCGLGLGLGLGPPGLGLGLGLGPLGLGLGLGLGFSVSCTTLMKYTGIDYMGGKPFYLYF